MYDSLEVNEMKWRIGKGKKRRKKKTFTKTRMEMNWLEKRRLRGRGVRQTNGKSVETPEKGKKAKR